jgi:hypothetical protein
MQAHFSRIQRLKVQQNHKFAQRYIQTTKTKGYFVPSLDGTK